MLNGLIVGVVIGFLLGLGACSMTLLSARRKSAPDPLAVPVPERGGSEVWEIATLLVWHEVREMPGHDNPDMRWRWIVWDQPEGKRSHPLMFGNTPTAGEAWSTGRAWIEAKRQDLHLPGVRELL